MTKSNPFCPKCSYMMFEIVKSEFVCTKCGNTFSLEELVHQWGFDVADLCEEVKVTNFPEPIVDIKFDYVSLEPLWMHKSERIHAYELVTEMLCGVPYIDDYTDLLATQAHCQ